MSHSDYWNDTAIFVIEDDAQDGPDHVDAHRSTAFVISKYAPRRMDGGKPAPVVDSTFYTTVNMLRTMETLLGLPAMNNNDDRAAFMANLLAGPGSSRLSTPIVGISRISSFIRSIPRILRCPAVSLLTSGCIRCRRVEQRAMEGSNGSASHAAAAPFRTIHAATEVKHARKLSAIGIGGMVTHCTCHTTVHRSAYGECSLFESHSSRT